MRIKDLKKTCNKDNTDKSILKLNKTKQFFFQHGTENGFQIEFQNKINDTKRNT